jgi:DNA-binding XRE family transcriptional regulator
MGDPIQYLIQPGSEKRLVVITEDYYLSLLDRSGEATPTSAQSTAEIPDDVLARIHEGENPLMVLRGWRQLNGRQLATMLGVSPSMVSQMERHWKLGSMKTTIRLAEVLAIPIDLLVKIGNAKNASRGKRGNRQKNSRLLSAYSDI